MSGCWPPEASTRPGTIFRRECFGHDFGYFGPLLAPGAGPEELEAIHREKLACYGQFLGCAVKNEHLFALLHLMRPEYHTALVTAPRANSGEILARFGGGGQL